MNVFSFTTDDESYAYALKIAEKMQTFFGISEKEAIGRINQFWQGQVIVGPMDWLYHEDTDYWAKWIYYGGAKFWLGEDNLRPKPYP